MSNLNIQQTPAEHWHVVMPIGRMIHPAYPAYATAEQADAAIVIDEHTTMACSIRACTGSRCGSLTTLAGNIK